MSAVLETRGPQRAIVLRTRGQRHGPITRLVSPSDIGEFIKPFVFLDLFDISAATAAPNFGWHPHSGIATLTVVHEGAIEYQETTGVKGMLHANGIEWMRAGGGVWHTGAAVQAKGFQLWIALPAELENLPSQSHYLSADQVPADEPARVILGSHGRVKSPISAPERINYLDVQLAAGERWTYEPPFDHEVAWLAVSEGSIRAPEPVSAGEFVAFEESNDAIVIQADRKSRFVLGSAARHPHDLVLGRYSVHTTRAALAAGESQIQRIGNQLIAAGLLR